MITRMSGKSGLEMAFPTHQGEFGTCDFMTETCRKECPFWISERDVATLLYFRKQSASTISNRLAEEIIQTKATMLSWFTEAGDCPKIMTEKIVSIIKNIAFKGIPQNGFTRNKEFWSLLNSVKNVHICLTEEDSEKAKSLSSYGLVAVPDYNLRRVTINGIYVCGGGIITCGEANVSEGDREYEEDCSLCALRRIGCYGFTKNRKMTA